MPEVSGRVIAVGEILWDVFDTEEHLGGAPLNFSVQAARLGHHVELLSAVAKDDRGRKALALAEQLPVSTALISVVDAPPTGHVTVTVDDDGQPDYVIHRPAAYDALSLTADALSSFVAQPPDWIYFGTLLQTNAAAHAVTKQLLESAPTASRLYDVNLRRDSYSRELLAELLPLATILKINVDEVAEVRRLFGEPSSDLSSFAHTYADRYGYKGICITLGADGCYLYWDGREMQSPSYPVVPRDTVGAGDAFTGAFLHGVINEWPIEKTADFANRVGALIASRPGAVPEWSSDEAWALRR